MDLLAGQRGKPNNSDHWSSVVSAIKRRDNITYKQAIEQWKKEGKPKFITDIEKKNKVTFIGEEKEIKETKPKEEPKQKLKFVDDSKEKNKIRVDNYLKDFNNDKLVSELIINYVGNFKKKWTEITKKFMDKKKLTTKDKDELKILLAGLIGKRSRIYTDFINYDDKYNQTEIYNSTASLKAINELIKYYKDMISNNQKTEPKKVIKEKKEKKENKEIKEIKENIKKDISNKSKNRYERDVQGDEEENIDYYERILNDVLNELSKIKNKSGEYYESLEDEKYYLYESFKNYFNIDITKDNWKKKIEDYKKENFEGNGKKRKLKKYKKTQIKI